MCKQSHARGNSAVFTNFERAKNSVATMLSQEFAWNSMVPLRPVGAVERAIVYGFCDVGGFDVFGAFEIGNRAADFEDAIVGTSGETQTGNGVFKKVER